MDANTLKFVCVNTIVAKVFTNSDIKSKIVGYAPNGRLGHWNGVNYDSDNSHNTNELIGNTDGEGHLFSHGIPLNTQYTDLQPIKTYTYTVRTLDHLKQSVQRVKLRLSRKYQ